MNRRRYEKPAILGSVGDWAWSLHLSDLREFLRLAFALGENRMRHP